jgi:hypothetical protein
MSHLDQEFRMTTRKNLFAMAVVVKWKRSIGLKSPMPKKSALADSLGFTKIALWSDHVTFPDLARKLLTNLKHKLN